jgi:hypothetical protein
VKKFLIIIGAVLCYSIFEIALLLIYLMPESYRSWRDSLLGIVHLFTIPGIAALFSITLFGNHQWKRRVAVCLLMTPAFALSLVLLTLPLGLLATILEKMDTDLGGSALFLIAGRIYVIVVLAVVAASLFFINRKARERSVELESSRWLAERRAAIDHRDIKWRDLGIRASLWIPSALVLMVFSFLPEVWGLITHLQEPKAGQLTGYQVTIPPTWIIHYHRSTGVSGMAGQGMAFGLKRYLHRHNLPLSGWGVGVHDEPHRRASSLGDEVAHHEFQIGGTTLSCSEYLPAWDRELHSAAEPLVYIECSSSDRLYATFLGEKIHVPTFYKMLATITPAPST